VQHSRPRLPRPTNPPRPTPCEPCILILSPRRLFFRTCLPEPEPLLLGRFEGQAGARPVIGGWRVREPRVGVCRNTIYIQALTLRCWPGGSPRSVRVIAQQRRCGTSPFRGRSTRVACRALTATRRPLRPRRQVHINGWFETASDALVWPRASGDANPAPSGELLLPGALWNEVLIASAVEAYVDLLQVLARKHTRTRTRARAQAIVWPTLASKHMHPHPPVPLSPFPARAAAVSCHPPICSSVASTVHLPRFPDLFPHAPVSAQLSQLTHHHSRTFRSPAPHMIPPSATISQVHPDPSSLLPYPLLQHRTFPLWLCVLTATVSRRGRRCRRCCGGIWRPCTASGRQERQLRTAFAGRCAGRSCSGWRSCRCSSCQGTSSSRWAAASSAPAAPGSLSALSFAPCFRSASPQPPPACQHHHHRHLPPHFRVHPAPLLPRVADSWNPRGAECGRCIADARRS
jgi:hypothetical protein